MLKNIPGKCKGEKEREKEGRKEGWKGRRECERKKVWLCVCLIVRESKRRAYTHMNKILL